jgi:hypothetical protein
MSEGDSYCLRCHAPVIPPQRVVPLQPDEEDYTTHVVSGRPKPRAAPSPPPDYRPPVEKKNRAPYLVGAIAGGAVVLILLLLGGIIGGAIALYPSQRPEAAQKNRPQAAPAQPTTQTPTPRSQPTRAAEDANPYSPPPTNTNVDDPPSTNANVYAPPPAPKPPPVDLVAGAMVVEALHYWYRPFTVEPGNFRAVAVGRFSATGGQNDIEAIILPAEQMPNFQRGAQIYAPLHTGYITGRDFKVPLPPGDYYLIFNNQRSLFTGKSVTAFVQLRYE